MKRNYGALPDTLYLARVPILATYSEEEASIFGLPLNTQNGKYDQDTFTEMTTVMITIDRMIDIYMLGFPITIVNYLDTKEIFNHLDTYLKHQVDKIQYSINRPFQEDSRMAEIDKFLSEMFAFNKETIVAGMVQPGNGFDLGIGLMGGVNSVTNERLSLRTVSTNNKPSINAAYSNAPGNPYIQPNQPIVNMNNVTREKIVKPKAGSINAAFLNK